MKTKLIHDRKHQIKKKHIKKSISDFIELAKASQMSESELLERGYSDKIIKLNRKSNELLQSIDDRFSELDGQIGEETTIDDIKDINERLNALQKISNEPSEQSIPKLRAMVSQSHKLISSDRYENEMEFLDILESQIKQANEHRKISKEINDTSTDTTVLSVKHMITAIEKTLKIKKENRQAHIYLTTSLRKMLPEKDFKESQDEASVDFQPDELGDDELNEMLSDLHQKLEVAEDIEKRRKERMIEANYQEKQEIVRLYEAFNHLSPEELLIKISEMIDMMEAIPKVSNRNLLGDLQNNLDNFNGLRTHVEENKERVFEFLYSYVQDHPQHLDKYFKIIRFYLKKSS